MKTNQLRLASESAAINNERNHRAGAGGSLIDPRRLAIFLLSSFHLACLGCSNSAPEQTAKRNQISSDAQSETDSKLVTNILSKDESEARHGALQEQLKSIEGKLSNITPVDALSEGDLEVDFKIPKNILGKEFLWGSSLQYAVSINTSTGLKDEQKSYVLGNRVVYLQRNGIRLQMLSREDLDTESDFPSRKVIGEFEIQAESNDALSLQATTFGNQSAELAGITKSGMNGFKASLRSIEFDTAEEVLLMEVTLAEKTGAFHNVLESIIPRESITGKRPGLAKNTPPSFPLSREGNPPDFDTLVERIGIFPTQIWLQPDHQSSESDLSQVTKERKTFITKFNTEDGRTIDWWVTSNTPDTLLPEFKAGVEGWNRYFNLFRREKPVMRFMGKLPERAKIGDPRLNIIVFDAVSKAPSAYESQAVDPMTGYQSHSLIYMPFAWYNISGERYLKGGDDAGLELIHQSDLLDTSRFSSQIKRNIKCQRLIAYHDVPFLVHSRAASSADEAGRALLRSTLLHEVGHALGMDHNFKGTLSGDISKYNETDWIYSNSSMDYNPFALEDSLFTDLSDPNRDVTKGLIQPYDRQFIDIVYNGGLGTIERGEPGFPFCNDSDHNNTTNGVDPFCRQYDFFASPSQTLAVPLARLASRAVQLDMSQGGFITLFGVLNRDTQDLLADVRLSRLEAAQEFNRRASAAFKHFLQNGSYSVLNALIRDARLLGEWKPVDGIQQDTEVSFKTGLQYAAEFISGLFESNGRIQGHAFNTYERQTQRILSTQMAGMLGTAYDETQEEFKNTSISSQDDSTQATQKFAQAAQMVLEAQEQFFRAIDIQKDVEIGNLVIELQAELSRTLTAASVRLIRELGSITVHGAYSRQIVSDRPQIRPEFTHALYAPLARILIRRSASVAERAAALPWLKVFDSNSSKFAPQLIEPSDSAETPGELAADTRKKIRSELIQSLQEEISPISAKVQAGTYLTANERESHEFLTDTLAILALQ